MCKQCKMCKYCKMCKICKYCNMCTNTTNKPCIPQKIPNLILRNRRRIVAQINIQGSGNFLGVYWRNGPRFRVNLCGNKDTCFANQTFFVFALLTQVPALVFALFAQVLALVLVFLAQVLALVLALFAQVLALLFAQVLALLFGLPQLGQLYPVPLPCFFPRLPREKNNHHFFFSSSSWMVLSEILSGLDDTLVSSSIAFVWILWMILCPPSLLQASFPAFFCPPFFQFSPLASHGFPEN